MSIIEKLKKSRQLNVEAGEKTFTITRPTPMQAMDWLTDISNEPLSSTALQAIADSRFSLQDKTWSRLAQSAIERFVIDWPGMTELDIIPGGDGSSIAFDRELFLLWVQDYPEIITELGYKTLESWINYIEAQQALEKKPEIGISAET